MPARLVLETLKHVWQTLEPLKLPMAVMGGIALASWDHIRATKDVDLLIGIGQTDVNLILRRLVDAKLRPKRQPPVLTLDQVRIVQLLYELPGAFVELQVDLLLAESDYHVEALARRSPARLPELDIDVLVLSCEDLIVHKLLAGRIIDRADVAALLRANRNSLDVGYLSKWIAKLTLTDDWGEIWTEAFPGETLPTTS